MKYRPNPLSARISQKRRPLSQPRHASSSTSASSAPLYTAPASCTSSRGAITPYTSGSSATAQAGQSASVRTSCPYPHPAARHPPHAPIIPSGHATANASVQGPSGTRRRRIIPSAAGTASISPPCHAKPPSHTRQISARRSVK